MKAVLFRFSVHDCLHMGYDTALLVPWIFWNIAYVLLHKFDCLAATIAT